MSELGYRLEHVFVGLKRGVGKKPVLCLIIDGEIRTVGDWAKAHGISAHTLRSRATRRFPKAELFLPPRVATINPVKLAQRQKAAATESAKLAEQQRVAALLAQAFRPYVRTAHAAGR